MRRNALRVIDFEAQFIKEIFDWFKINSEIDGVEFTKEFNVKVDVGTDLDYDFGEESVGVVRLLNDGTLVLTDDREVGLEGLHPYELAFILDEIEAGNFKNY